MKNSKNKAIEKRKGLRKGERDFLAGRHSAARNRDIDLMRNHERLKEKYPHLK